MLMDPPVMQIDCQLQNDVEKIPSIAYGRKHNISYGDCGWTSSDVRPTNEAVICKPVESNNASQMCIDEVLDVSLQDSPENSQVIKLRNNTDDSCSNDVRLQLNVSAGSNGLQTEDVDLNKHSEDAHHPQEEIHSPPPSSSPSSCKFDGGALPHQGVKVAEEHVKVDDNVDAASNNDGTDLDGMHATPKDLQCTLEDLSEVACTIDLVRNKSSTQEENETSVSPRNGMDQLLHNNSCNGDTNYNGSELNTENAGDEEDRAVALWVKWRGKWQTGIRCCKADIPLPTLKAKPTHDRKSYIVVFFPRTKTYSWVDMLLVLPIEERPLPLVNGTHRKWRRLVKDLSFPRWFIMQKFAISMLNFSDELHIEAMIENAQKATSWKEFALEASCSSDYADLGKMLVKLQSMILPDYISCQWLQSSFDLWKQKCISANNAEAIEILYEELKQFVLWDKIDELWNAPVQLELVPEWKTWKQEVMKLYFSSHPAGNAGNHDKNSSFDDPALHQQVSRKRPKLEVRRGKIQVSHMGDSNYRALCEDPNRMNLPNNFITHETAGPLEMINQNNAVAFPGNSVGQVSESSSANSALQSARLELDPFKSSRQCSAYIEAKGRQCGRWANDGDIYCCVHQSMHFVDHSSREDKAIAFETPLCSGMTNIGRKCKHRAQHGSTFCKKHRSRTNLDPMHPENLFGSLEMIHGREKTPKLVTMAVDVSGEKAHVMGVMRTTTSSIANTDSDTSLCIGIRSHDDTVECHDYAKRHTLYCEKHLPKFLKRARDGKSRLISKDVFISLLKGCTSRKDKVCLHEACEFLYWFLRNNLTHQHAGGVSDHMPQLLAQVSKNPDLGEFLLKLIATEREKLANFWGFGTNIYKQIYPENIDGQRIHPSSGLKCKICTHEFSDDQALGLHWTEVHKKETRWLFRGYSCAVCMDPFTNRKVLERHVQEKHGAQYLQYSTLIRCMSCNSNFLNTNLLWQHIVSDHAQDFRLLDVSQQPKGRSVKQTEMTNGTPLYDNIEKDGSPKCACRLCGLTFDLPTDLGRHHQVSHMNQSEVDRIPPGPGKYQLNRGRHYYSAFKKSLRPSSTLRKRSRSGTDKNFKYPNSALSMVTSQIVEPETASLGKLLDYQCSDVAQTLFSKIQKTKPHPSNLDILSVARSVCCKASLLATLEAKYGHLPENMFVKVAKLCSDSGIQIGWHLEEFLCPKGCKFISNSNTLLPIGTATVDLFEPPVSNPPNENEMWGMEEYHYILDSEHFQWKLKKERVVLCEDISFGKEKVPIACVIDVDAKESFLMKPEELVLHGKSVPWQGFHYITERLMDSALVDSKSYMAGCACSYSCSPENCDHMSLSDRACENQVDIYRTPMLGRCAYDDNGKIILQEGYPIFECNSSCTCDTSCQNKVLQKGLLVKLELFKTESKGWAIRAAEPIPQGTFVCEYIGEVVKGDDSMKYAEREAKGGCSYKLNITSQINSERVNATGTVTYMIDATRYGNVSRFINHSCSPNLSIRLVLVESKDCQLARIGLFANQDITTGEELAYDYRQNLREGSGCACLCGSKNCRGLVY